ncbi:unnamed protein product [Strongylus vulgaris]|uniref:Uncharacterized protein n=1 Tax=Strongylus vulgaris TaxID=40348 RepID=A0A3P7JTV0_STRVU|nr:unnamed protein product [Strongylus vulgaris]
MVSSSHSGGDSGCRKYNEGLSSSKVSEAENEFKVPGCPDAQLRVSHASRGCSLIHKG